MFIERNLDLAMKYGSVAMITMQSWMFLSSFEKLRSQILKENTILSMAHLGAHAFDSIGGEVVSTTAFVFENRSYPNYKGGYLRLVDGNSEIEKLQAIKEGVKNPDCGWFYRASAADFKKIPGSPIAYWVSDNMRFIFEHYPSISDIGKVKQGLITGNNDIFLRYWHEVNFFSIKFGCLSRSEALETGNKWFPYTKGGEYRKWYGNLDFVVNWFNDGVQIKNFKDRNGKLLSRPQNMDSYFSSGVTWFRTSSSNFSARILPEGVIFDGESPTLFSKENLFFLSFFCTKICFEWMKLINPTLHFQIGDVKKISIVNNIPKNRKVQIENNTNSIEPTHKLKNSYIDYDK